MQKKINIKIKPYFWREGNYFATNVLDFNIKMISFFIELAPTVYIIEFVRIMEEFESLVISKFVTKHIESRVIRHIFRIAFPKLFGNWGSSRGLGGQKNCQKSITY